MQLLSKEYTLGALTSALAALLLAFLPDSLPVELDAVVIIAFGLLAAVLTPLLFKNGVVAVANAKQAYVDRNELTTSTTKDSGIEFTECVGLCHDIGFGLVVCANPSLHRQLHIIASRSLGQEVETIGESLYSGVDHLCMVVGIHEPIESYASVKDAIRYIWFDEYPQTVARGDIIAAVDPDVVFVSTKNSEGFIVTQTIRLK